MSAEYDFRNWTSFPSSLKLIGQYDNPGAYRLFEERAVRPGAVITLSCQVKALDLTFDKGEKWLSKSYFSVHGYYEAGREWKLMWDPTVPFGTYGWTPFTRKFTIPSGVTKMRITIYGGWGPNRGPAATWFDSLRIHMDDVLIYSNDFTNWSPYIGAGLGGACGALTGYLITRKPLYALAGIPTMLIGAAIGYYTAKP